MYPHRSKSVRWDLSRVVDVVIVIRNWGQMHLYDDIPVFRPVDATICISGRKCRDNLKNRTRAGGIYVHHNQHLELSSFCIP